MPRAQDAALVAEIRKHLRRDTADLVAFDGRRALYFSGHYDVVPAQSRGLFEPVVRKRNLHGRGSADMKGRVAAMEPAHVGLQGGTSE